ncbi:MAG TPA: phosphoadenosine phosphosulfate reductase family protein [Chthonomonadaceae bacterium]|nr:phosphoadenosine phosphosulfate reductase family protein [Chthonomonadaceae bacterium]
MARVKRFLDTDVLTAAKERIRHIFDTHDTIAVCFSGGKDSLATLHLTKEVAEEAGALPLNVVFRDEELIPDPVIEFVNSYRLLPWVKMLYFAVPLASTKFILGRAVEYIQWDPNRKHLRPIPEHAITLPEGDKRIFDQYSMDAFIASWYKGKIAFLTGIRAAESLMRYRASVNKLNESYINASGTPNVSLCKPLYDWQENDVFRFFYERGIRYCPLYDAQHLAGASLRVSTPLHAESAKHLHRLPAIAPIFYDQVMQLFPEMQVQARYWQELDKDALKERYGQSYDGVRAYILEHIQDESQQRKALTHFEKVLIRARNRPEGYPPAYVLTWIMTGAFKRELLPLRSKGA